MLSEMFGIRNSDSKRKSNRKLDLCFFFFFSFCPSPPTQIQNRNWIEKKKKKKNTKPNTYPPSWSTWNRNCRDEKVKDTYRQPRTGVKRENLLKTEEKWSSRERRVNWLDFFWFFFFMVIFVWIFWNIH